MAWVDFTGLDDGIIPEVVFAKLVRGHRRGLLRNSDWRVAVDAPGDTEAWIGYRAELRDGSAILATRVENTVFIPDPPEEG
jgi:hypothetical protein